MNLVTGVKSLTYHDAKFPLYDVCCIINFYLVSKSLNLGVSKFFQWKIDGTIKLSIAKFSDAKLKGMGDLSYARVCICMHVTHCWYFSTSHAERQKGLDVKTLLLYLSLGCMSHYLRTRPLTSL